MVHELTARRLPFAFCFVESKRNQDVPDSDSFLPSTSFLLILSTFIIKIFLFSSLKRETKKKSVKCRKFCIFCIFSIKRNDFFEREKKVETFTNRVHQVAREVELKFRLKEKKSCAMMRFHQRVFLKKICAIVRLINLTTKSRERKAIDLIDFDRSCPCGFGRLRKEQLSDRKCRGDDDDGVKCGADDR